MRKIKIFMLTAALITAFVQPVMSVPIYLDQENTGIETFFIDGQSYITAKDAYTLLNDSPSPGEDTSYLIPLQPFIDHMSYYVQRAKDGIYLNTNAPVITRQVIGYSYQQHPIEAVYMVPPDYKQTILITFALHGFEDQYNGDGELLVAIAQQVIKNYSDQPELLLFTRLIVIPCVNPDGVFFGVSKNSFGRCNAQGIDLNRDFDYNWAYISNSRYQTGTQAFTTPEAQILRDIVLKEKPDIVLDFHGWLNCCYSSDLELKNSIVSAFSLGQEKVAFPGYKPKQGYFFGWASQYAMAALIEYPFMDSSILTDQTMQVLNQLIQN